MPPESTTLEAPAPAAAPTAAPTAAPAPSRATPEINISTLAAPTGTPAKPGSAKDRMNQELRKKFSADLDPAPASAVREDAEPAPTAGDEPTPAGAPADPKDPKKKISPWKLVEEYKQKLAAVEAEKLEVEKRAIKREDFEAQTAKSAELEKRSKELEEEIIFTNFSKSKEFADKYQAPYDAAWKRAMKDLGDVTIDDNGATRTLKAGDILDLVNMPLQKARETAENLFGGLANDVMAHRTEIRKLFDEQSAALEDARTNGVTREKQRGEQFQAAQKEVQKFTSDVWAKSNEKALADPNVSKFLKPVEGDVEWNTRLERATKLADRAFSENPMRPDITPAQRAEIVERHAAIRNRSIAYSMLRYENTKLETTLSELRAELKQYKGSEPSRGGSEPTPKTNGEGKGMAGMLAELRKRAK